LPGGGPWLVDPQTCGSPLAAVPAHGAEDLLRAMSAAHPGSAIISQCRANNFRRITSGELSVEELSINNKLIQAKVTKESWVIPQNHFWQETYSTK